AGRDRACGHPRPGVGLPRPGTADRTPGAEQRRRAGRLPPAPLQLRGRHAHLSGAAGTCLGDASGAARTDRRASIPDRLPQIEIARGEAATVLVFRNLLPLNAADEARLAAFAD